MPKGNSLSALKNTVVALDKLLKAKEAKYTNCKQNMDNLKSEAVKAFFSKEAYELALNKCNLLIDFYEKKLGLDKSMQELEKCVKSEAIYKCSSQLSNLEKKVIEMFELNQQIDSVNKLAKKSSIQEDLANAASFLKPFCQYVSPNDPNYESAMEFCGKGVDDANL